MSSGGRNALCRRRRADVGGRRRNLHSDRGGPRRVRAALSPNLPQRQANDGNLHHVQRDIEAPDTRTCRLRKGDGPPSPVRSHDLRRVWHARKAKVQPLQTVIAEIDRLHQKCSVRRTPALAKKRLIVIARHWQGFGVQGLKQPSQPVPAAFGINLEAGNPVMPRTAHDPPAARIVEHGRARATRSAGAPL